MNLLRHYCSTIFILLACLACNPQRTKDTDIIAVTIAPTADIIHTLLGSADSTEVLVLLPEGATPESYEPTIQDMSKLASAKAWFYVGDLGFEQSWLSRIEELNPHLQLIRLDSGLSPIHHQSHTHTDGMEHKADPHYWMSLEGIHIMSKNAQIALTKLFPNKKLSAGADSIALRIEELKTLVATSTFRSESFAIYHPSLSYFAEEQGLRQLVIEQDGKEPTIHHLQQLVSTARKDNTQVMFFQKEFGANAKSSDYLIEEVNLRIVQINPFSADWYSELKAIIKALQ